MMSFTLASQPETFSVSGMFELTKELGLEGIDFVTLHDTAPAELRRMAEDIGVEVACHTFFADVNHDDPKARARGVDQIKRGIENAVILGAPCTMVPPMGKGEYSPQRSRRHIIDALAETVDFARKAGVTLTVENFSGRSSPCVTSDDLLPFVEQVPGLKITFDCANCLTGGEDPARSFTRCAEHVVHVHFKDYEIVPTNEKGGFLGTDGRWYRPAVMGQGAVDHREVLAAMKDAQYDGFINIEYGGRDCPAADVVRNATRFLRGLLAELN